MNKKQDLYKKAVEYGWTRAYERTTVKTLEEYFDGSAARVLRCIATEAFSYDARMANRNGVRFIMLPEVGRWRAAHGKVAGAHLLEEFGRMLAVEFGLTVRELKSMATYVARDHEFNVRPDLSKWLGEEEVKHYELVCLFAYGYARIGWAGSRGCWEV